MLPPTRTTEAIEGKGVGYYWSDVALKVLDDATAAKKEKAEAEKAKADKEKRDALAKAKRDAEKAAHHAPGGAEDGGAGNTDVHMEMKKSLLKKSLKKGLLAAKAKVLFHLGIRRDAAASPPVSPRGLKGLKTFRPPPEPATAHPAGAAAHADAKQHADDEPKGFLGSALKVCLALAQPWIVFFKFVWWLTGIGLDEDDKELQSAFLGQVFGIYALFTVRSRACAQAPGCRPSLCNARLLWRPNMPVVRFLRQPQRPAVVGGRSPPLLPRRCFCCLCALPPRTISAPRRACCSSSPSRSAAPSRRWKFSTRTWGGIRPGSRTTRPRCAHDCLSGTAALRGC